MTAQFHTNVLEDVDLPDDFPLTLPPGTLLAEIKPEEIPARMRARSFLSPERIIANYS